MMARSSRLSHWGALLLCCVRISSVRGASNSSSSAGTSGNESSTSDTMRDVIEDRDDLSLFRKSLTAVGLFDSLMDNVTATNLTVFAPLDDAINGNDVWTKYLANPKSYSAHLLHTVNNHIVDNLMDADGVFSAEVGSIVSREDFLVNNPLVKTIEGGQIVESIKTANGYLHIVTEALQPKFFHTTLEDMSLLPELGPDQEDDQRLSLVDVVDFLDVRSRYSVWNPDGMTNVACRIRAFNRMADYFTQTINESPDVKYGELMNASFKDETIHNFIEYGIINRVYDLDQMEHGYEELIMSQNGCAHMWVTKHHDLICFNDACLVVSPPAFSPAGTPSSRRMYVGSNGISYATDKCVICPGVAMLANYAAEYTMHNMKDIAQLFVSSEWNLRNLSMSIGDGSPVTVLAADNTAFFEVTGTDTTRLSTDMWRPHLHDFLRHMVLQGNYTAEDLKAMAEKNGGAVNMTTLSGQTIEISVSEETGNLQVEGGDVSMSNIHGVDGQVHFIKAVPLVRSFTHSVYDIGWWMNATEQSNLIDAVFLRSDMKRLEPLTAIYAPDVEWRNKVLPLEKIERVLENHLYEGLMWCSTLRELAKDPNKRTIESLNGQTWYLSVNEDNFPCFDILTEDGAEKAQSCITECDILSKNGIVHMVDKVILKDALETRGPSPAPPPGSRPPIDPDSGGVPNTGDANRPNLESQLAGYKRPKRLYDWNAFEESGGLRSSRMLPILTGVALALGMLL